MGYNSVADIIGLASFV